MKDAASRKAGPKKAAAKAPSAKPKPAAKPAGTLTRTTKPKPPAPDKPAPGPAAAATSEPKPKAKAAKAPARAPVEKTRIVIPMSVYEPQKDAIKAPFKEQGLKWNFLGEGKGLYKREGLHVFTQFLDDGVHYSMWGDDKPAQATILAAWEKLLGRSFVQDAKAAGVAAERSEEKEKGSEALRLWRMQEPQPRPGEPEFFFKKRVAEWQAKKPA